MYAVKWSVLQYVVIRPCKCIWSFVCKCVFFSLFSCAVLSIVGIIAQAKGVLCESGSWSFRTAKAYITLFDGISITCVSFADLVRCFLLLISLQNRLVWSVCLLWSDEGGTGGKETTCEILVHQAYCYAHLLSVLRCKSSSCFARLLPILTVTAVQRVRRPCHSW